MKDSSVWYMIAWFVMLMNVSSCVTCSTLTESEVVTMEQLWFAFVFVGITFPVIGYMVGRGNAAEEAGK